MKLFWTDKILQRWWRRGTPSTLAQVIRCKTITWVSSSDVFLGPIECVRWNTSKEHVWMVDDKWCVYNFYILIHTYCAHVISIMLYYICYVYFRYYRFWVYIDYSFHDLCQAGVPTSVTVPVGTSESRFSNSMVADSSEGREKFTMICWIGFIFKHVTSMKGWICNLKSPISDTTFTGFAQMQQVKYVFQLSGVQSVPS